MLLRFFPPLSGCAVTRLRPATIRPNQACTEEEDENEEEGEEFIEEDEKREYFENVFMYDHQVHDVIRQESIWARARVHATITLCASTYKGKDMMICQLVPMVGATSRVPIKM